ncbi:17615_t:CDS:2, partial [Funneliformis geosporum]
NLDMVSGWVEEMGEVYDKEFKLLPLPKPYQETKQKFTEYCQGLNGQVANLIESYRAYFTVNIYPLLNKPEGDKTLLFRCKRLLDNKIIGESSSLFLDLVI